MPLERVHEVLRRHLKNGIELEHWLEKADATYTGTRLEICLAIDLDMGLISPADVDKIIASLPSMETDVGQHFSQGIELHPEKARLRGMKSRKYNSPDSDVYVRILQLTSFVTHYLTDFEYGLDLSDLQEVQETFLPHNLLDRAAGSSLGYVRNYWTGRNDIVWVAPYSDILSAAENHRDRAAGALNDALGLGFAVAGDNVPFLIAVKYPSNSEIKCSKPNSFVADWSTSEGYYLSSAHPEEWGMTQSCTGELPGQRERVHDGFHGLDDQFVGFSIGSIDNIVGNLPRIIAEGLRRLDGCTGAVPGAT